MKRLILSLAILTCPVAAAFAQPDDKGAVALLESRLHDALLEDFAPAEPLHTEVLELSDWGFANDAVMNQLYLQTTLTQAECRDLERRFDAAAGQWTDIDYSDANRGSWQPSLHLSRMCALARAYSTAGHPLYHSADLAAMLRSAGRWWAFADPRNPNWWWNEIGIPRKAGIFLLIMGERADPVTREAFLEIMHRIKVEPRFTGQNLVWIAGVILMRAAIEGDAATAAQMKDILESTVQITDKEGLQDDWSFHLHGHMLQFGNYGLAFFDSIAFWSRVLEGTPWDFGQNCKDIVAGFGNNGLLWCFWGGYMDPSMRGRHVFPGSGRGKDIAFGIARENLAAAGIGFEGSFQGGRNLGGPLGGRYFPRSDVGIWRTSSWYSSIRMHSSRTLGYEMTNGENLGGYYSADGALLTMVSGDEYDDIFPCWDWWKVPGVTAPDGSGLTPVADPRKAVNATSHVGGFSAAGVMAATMELKRDSLAGFKSVFFFEDMVVNLGAGLRSGRIRSLATAVEQNYLQPNFRRRGNAAYNGRTGYVVLDGDLALSAGPQSGKWNRMEPSLPDTLVTRDIFKMWIKHDAAKVHSSEGDTYAYAILPCSKACRMARKPAVEILCNTSDCQALRYRGTVVAIFHRAGEISSRRTRLGVTEPCIVIRRGKKEYRQHI